MHCPIGRQQLAFSFGQLGKYDRQNLELYHIIYSTTVQASNFLDLYSFFVFHFPTHTIELLFNFILLKCIFIIHNFRGVLTYLIFLFFFFLSKLFDITVTLVWPGPLKFTLPIIFLCRTSLRFASDHSHNGIATLIVR